MPMPARSLRSGAGRGFSTAGRFWSARLSGSVRSGWLVVRTSDDLILAEAAKVYGPMPGEKFPIPAVDISKVDPKYFRRTVRYDSKEAPGTIVVDPNTSTSIASRTLDPPPATGPMSAAMVFCGTVTLMSGANPNGRRGHRPWK